MSGHTDKIKELVVVSGKGGTGKTSIAASFAAITEDAVIADCDVDAADLHLVLRPLAQIRTLFSGGKIAAIRQEDCIGCGACLARCRFGAVVTDGSRTGGATFAVDPIACEGCGVCVWSCPAKAIDFKQKTSGAWYYSETVHGSMVHAELGIAENNSGKLVSLVRSQARKLAQQQGSNLVIIDGPPGIGCPVIASVTGASLVLIVTEPTMSSRHDLERVVELAEHFGIPAMVCVNKFDINLHMTRRIEEFCEKRGLQLVAKIGYDQAVIDAQVAGRSVVEYMPEAHVSCEIQAMWEAISVSLNEGSSNGSGEDTARTYYRRRHKLQV